MGKPRDKVSCPRLAELNNYVPVSVLEGDVRQSIDKFHVVVVTEGPLDQLLELNDLCHSKDIAFISADIRGLFGWVSLHAGYVTNACRRVFCDFGKEFVVHDSTGEEPVSGMIVSISKVIVLVLSLLTDRG